MILATVGLVTEVILDEIIGTPVQVKSVCLNLNTLFRSISLRLLIVDRFGFNNTSLKSSFKSDSILIYSLLQHGNDHKTYNDMKLVHGQLHIFPHLPLIV